MYDQATLETSLQLNAKTFATTVFMNNGKGSFTAQPLPNQAQLSPTYAILSEDFDGDGKIDILLAGNTDAPDVETGPYDAGNGLFLKGGANGGLTPITLQESGFFVPAQVRNMKTITLANGNTLILLANNSEAMQVFLKAKVLQ